MMGPKQEAQAALFYEFSLEDHVPQDHLLRSIDRFVDLSDIRQYLAEFYSHTGRPSVDPELLIRMLLVGYCFGIRSERRLCEEVHLNLAYRWFCGLDLSDTVPNHSTFSKNRHGRFRESKLLRHLFEKTVARCISDGLVSGQRLAADASLIEADANKQNSTPKEDWDRSAIDPRDAPRAVREYLDVLDDAAFGAASQVQPKFTSHSDPASQWTAARKGPAFFNQLGEMRDRSYEHQIHKASGLNFLVAAIILWNTKYLEASITDLRKNGVAIPNEIIKHIAPLGWAHVGLTGDYLWNMNPPLSPERLRPLRKQDLQDAA